MINIVVTWLLIGLNLACVALWGTTITTGELTPAGSVLAMLLVAVQTASAIKIWFMRA